MMLPVENNDVLLLFFHDLGSSSESPIYTEITRRPKYCQTVDYRKDFKKVFEIHESLIKRNMKKYKRVVLAGEGLGGWFANHFANKYRLRALLINPCVYPQYTSAKELPILKNMTLSFPTWNEEDMVVLVEDNDSLNVADNRRTFVNLSDNWTIEYQERAYTSGKQLWYSLMMLCEDPVIWIDDATLQGED